MKTHQIKQNLAESEGTGILAESEGTGLSYAQSLKKIALSLTLAFSFQTATWADTLILFSEGNHVYSGVIQTATEVAKVEAVIDNGTLIGVSDVSINAVSDGSGIDAVSDGSGFTDAVSDGSGIDAVSDGSGIDAVSDGSGIDAVSDGSGIDAVSDGSGLTFSLDNNNCHIMHISSAKETISILLDQVVVDKQTIDCG